MLITADTTVVLVLMETYDLALQALGAMGSLIYVSGDLPVHCGHICGKSAAVPFSAVLAPLRVLVSLAAAFNLAPFPVQISFNAILIFGLWSRISGSLVACLVHPAHSESMRRESLASAGAWMPGDEAFSTAPVMLTRSLGSRGHLEGSWWPRQGRGA